MIVGNNWIIVILSNNFRFMRLNYVHILTQILCPVCGGNEVGMKMSRWTKNANQQVSKTNFRTYISFNLNEQMVNLF